MPREIITIQGKIRAVGLFGDLALHEHVPLGILFDDEMSSFFYSTKSIKY